MRVEKDQLAETSIKLTITADQAILDQIKTTVLTRLGREVRVPGFRPGKAPQALIEKHLNPSQLQTEFLEQAVNHLYVEAIQHEKLRPTAHPEVNILKFVPFTTLEFAATFEAVGEIKLADYRRFKLAPQITPVTAQDVKAVLDDLLQRAATHEPVERAAKLGDEVVIDFTGRDAKTNEAINGATGQAYPLLLGGQAFVPGFEEQLVGLKPGSETEFTLTFPKDYGVPDMRSRQVTFKVTVQQVQAVTKPKADDAFAATAGPFKTLAELKAEIKRQLTIEHERTDQHNYETQLLQLLTEKTTVAVPKSLVDEEMVRMEDEEKRNLVYRGQTWQEHLDQEGLDAEAHREQFRAEAEKRLKGGLALAEVAEREALDVSRAELADYTAQLKQQHKSDTAMQAELTKPENQRDLSGRLLNQKVFNKLREYAAPAGPAASKRA